MGVRCWMTGVERFVSPTPITQHLTPARTEWAHGSVADRKPADAEEYGAGLHDPGSAEGCNRRPATVGDGLPAGDVGDGRGTGLAGNGRAARVRRQRRDPHGYGRAVRGAGPGAVAGSILQLVRAGRADRAGGGHGGAAASYPAGDRPGPPGADARLHRAGRLLGAAGVGVAAR